MKRLIVPAILILALLFTINGALAAPGDVLYQNYGNGTATNDWVSNILTYTAGGRMTVGAGTSGNSYNATGTNWAGKVVNFSFVLEDTGQDWNDAGDTFRVGLSKDLAPACNPGDFGFDYNGANQGDGDYRFVDCASGYTIINARDYAGGKNHTFNFVINTSTNTSNAKLYYDGVLKATTNAQITGGIRSVWVGKSGTSPNDQSIYNITVCEEYCAAPNPPSVNIISLTLANAVNAATIGTVSISNVTGNLTFTYFNITGAGFCVTYTGNGTGTNCTATGSGTSTYFNTTNISIINGTQSLVGYTFQSLIAVQAQKLLLNTSISNFNATNGLIINQTTSGTVFLKALNGSNNIKIDVAGNYSQNVTCTVSAPLTTSYCNATGIYDNKYTIGARYGSNSIVNFTLTTTNSTIGVNNVSSTTTGAIVLNLLQGYYYNFNIQPTSTYSFSNITLIANASAQTYNFSLSLTNTFNLTFYDEITETKINETITLEVITDNSAQNYTVTNGTGNFSLLVPGDYTLRYRSTNYQERDYYVTLYNGTFNNLDLYMIDINTSSQVIVTVEDTAGDTIEEATVKLLRYFVSCNCYKTVEMAKTGFNGESGFWVQAVEGFYKWVVEYQGNTEITTGFENILTNTRAFTINTGDNYLETFVGINSVTSSVTLNRGTGSLTFAFNDPTNHISQACLSISYANGSKWDTRSSCTSGSSGSVILSGIRNDTNYKYTASIDTDSQYSDNDIEQGWINALNSGYDFGVVGSFLGAGIIMTLSAIFSFSAIAVVIISVIGTIALQFLGLVPFQMNFLIGLGAIAVGISLYLLRR